MSYTSDSIVNFELRDIIDCVNSSILPEIPTDNLYKFMSIGGVILIVTYIVSNVILQKEIYSLNDEVVLLALKAENDVSNLEDDIDYFSYLATSSGENTTLRLDNDYFVSRLQDIIVSKKEITREEAYLNGLLERNKSRNIFVSFMNEEVLNKVFWIGLLFTSIGFGLWYAQVQRYEDIILKKRAGMYDPKNELKYNFFKKAKRIFKKLN